MAIMGARGLHMTDTTIAQKFIERLPHAAALGM